MTWQGAALSLTDEAGALTLLHEALELGAELKPPPVKTLAQAHAMLASLHRPT